MTGAFGVKVSSRALIVLGMIVLGVSYVSASHPAQAATQATATPTLDPVAFVAPTALSDPASCGLQPGPHTLQLLDLATGSYEAPLSVPNCPWAVTVAPNNATAVVIGYTYTYSITIVHLDTDTVGKSVQFISPPLAPFVVVYSPNSEVAYVLAGGSDVNGMIYAIDTQTGAVLTSHSTEPFPHDAAIGLGGTTLAVTNNINTDVQTFSLPTLQPLATVAMPGNEGGSEATNGNIDWVLDHNFGSGQELTPLNLRTMTVGSPIPITDLLGEVLVTPAGDSAVLIGTPLHETGSNASGELAVIDLRTGIQRSTTFSDYYSGGEYMSPDGENVYVQTGYPNGPSVTKINVQTLDVGAEDVVTTAASALGIVGIGWLPPALPVNSGPMSPISPVRICDTRPNNPSQLTGPAAQCNGSTIPAGGTKDISVAGGFGVPANATAVILNVTAANPAGPGYLSVYPTGDTLPVTSSVDYTANEPVPNLVETGLGNGGDVSVYSSAATDLVIDVEGYVAPTASGGGGAGLYNALSSPVRICDTRAANPSGLSAPNTQCNGLTLAANGVLPVKVATMDGIPAGAIAAVFNVTVVKPTAPGFLTVFAGGGTAPFTSNLDYTSGQVTSNRVIVPLSVGGASAGEISVLSSASADVVVDVSGYYSAPGGSGEQFNAEPSPVRICDTRSTSQNNQCSGDTINPQQILTTPVTQEAGVPANAKAVVLNLIGVSPSAPTFLTVYPSTPTVPIVSDLNEMPGQTKANMVVATLSSTGTISIFNDAGSVDVVVDVLGWYS